MAAQTYDANTCGWAWQRCQEFHVLVGDTTSSRTVRDTRDAVSQPKKTNE